MTDVLPDPDAREVNIVMKDWIFLPDPVDVVPGETVLLHVVNGGLEVHELVIGDQRVQDAWEAAELATIPEGRPGAGGSILLLQKWRHDATAWEALPMAQQVQVIGRTKDESVELDDKPAESHVGRTDQDEFGKIFRRNMPYGTVTEHGTMFVGFSAQQRPLTAMLENMAGLTDGIRDELTVYTTALTGAYYFIPSTQSLRRWGAI